MEFINPVGREDSVQPRACVCSTLTLRNNVVNSPIGPHCSWCGCQCSIGTVNRDDFAIAQNRNGL